MNQNKKEGIQLFPTARAAAQIKGMIRGLLASLEFTIPYRTKFDVLRQV